MRRVAIVTGTTRGLGRKIAEILVENYSQNFEYIFTQRCYDHEQLTNVLKQINPQAKFVVTQLDITKQESRQQFVKWFTSNYNKFDVLYNNAAFCDDIDCNEIRLSKELTYTTFHTNFISTVDFTEDMFPYLSDDGRIVEVSSRLGKIQYQSETGKQIIQDETLDKERLYKLAYDYIENVEDESKPLQFGNFVYCASKALLNTYVRFVASKYAKPNQTIFALHPGQVQTDMGGKNQPLTVDQACPDLAKVIAEYQFGRTPFHGKLVYDHKEFGF